MKLNDYLDIHPDVEDAINNKLPIVALESTIISHGMPYPNNIETALYTTALVLLVPTSSAPPLVVYP